MLKIEKGLTLIELPTVVAIFSTITVITVPSIGGLIDNSKKDAHVMNVVQMINSAKTMQQETPMLALQAALRWSKWLLMRVLTK